MGKSIVIVIISVLCLIGALLPACQASQPTSGGTIKIISRVTLDLFGTPAEATGPTFLMIAQPVYEGIMRHDKNFHFKPKLAESWYISPDGKYATLTLKKGIKFHDGTSYNAQAVKQVMEASTGFANYLVNVSSIEATDEYTVRINFKTFDYGLMINLCEVGIGMGASPTAMKIKTPDATQIKDKIAGTGPFKFDSWQRNNFIKFVKNLDYWQKGKPYVDAIEIREVADVMTSLMSFKAGEADMLTGVLPQDVKELKAGGFEILVSDYSLVNNLMPDAGNADSPFADKRVREAVEYAIDKKAIAQTIGLGLWEPVYQWATSSEERYNPAVKSRTYDVKKASELLASAGYKDGFKTRIIAQTTANKEYLQAIQAYLKAVGIDAAIELYDGGRIAAINKDGWKNGLMVYLGMNGGIVSMQRYFSSTSTVFRSMLRSKDLLDKLNAAASNPDEKKHTELMKDLIKYISDECIGIPIYADWNKFATTKKVKDSGWGIGWGSWWEPENVYLTK